MSHYSKPSYILHGHAEGQGRNRSSEPIDGILIYDKLYVCEQIAVSGLGVYLCHVVCIFTMFVCVCTAFHTSVLISVIIDSVSHDFTLL